jgi:hypothetical protein
MANGKKPGRPIRPRPTREDIQASRAYRRRRSAPPGIKALRLAQLFRLFANRYGGPLPDDDSGRGDLRILLHHLGCTRDAADRMRSCARTWAPWLDDVEREQIIASIIARPLKFRADTLGRILNVTEEERTRLRLWTIGAVGRTAEQRRADRAERQRQRKEAKRRAAGALPRAEYLARARGRPVAQVRAPHISRAPV